MNLQKLLSITTLAFLVVACSDQESLIIGKWRSQNIGSKPEDLQAALANPKPTGRTLEFTKTEFISPFGARTPTEYVSDKPGEILVYQIVLGSRIGNTYRVINKDTLTSSQYGQTFVYYRIK
jgi:hypothetical protein